MTNLVGVDPERELCRQQSFQLRPWNPGGGGGARQQMVELPVDDPHAAVRTAALRPVREPVVAVSRHQRRFQASPERHELVGAQSHRAAPQDAGQEVDGTVDFGLHRMNCGVDGRRRRH